MIYRYDNVSAPGVLLSFWLKRLVWVLLSSAAAQFGGTDVLRVVVLDLPSPPEGTTMVG